MNNLITPTNDLAAIVPTLAALCHARGVPSPEKFELEDTVLRAPPYAWDIGDEAAPLHAQIAEIKAAKQAADEAEALRISLLPPPVPFSVTPWQMRRALNQIGLRSTVESAVAAASQDNRDGWEYALEIRRDNQLLANMAAALGMGESQLDDLFRLAGTFQ
jgi:hypothetical protein